MHCFYDVTTRFNSGAIIHMTVLDTDLSCNDEEITLLVFDAFSASAQYLGRICKGGNRTFVSPKDRLYLVYQTGRFPDSAFTPPPPLHLAQTSPASDSTTAVNTSGSQSGGQGGRAFKLQVKGVPEFSQCYGYKAKILSAKEESHQFVSPYFPVDVAPNVHCRWLIKAPEGRSVEIKVVNASMRGSNNCQNFGLYLYDGKTTYDDAKLAVICDNQSDSQIAQRYRSSGNFLLVVFSSGSHVLHSGGGVKIIYKSVSRDDEQGSQNNSLLFTLLGSITAVACLTAFLAILRYIIIPVRQKKSARRLDILAISRESGISEPPPPYTPNQIPPELDLQRVENTYSAAFPSTPTVSELLYGHDFQATNYISDTASTFTSEFNESPHRAFENDYQELPCLTLLYSNENEPLPLLDAAVEIDENNIAVIGKLDDVNENTENADRGQNENHSLISTKHSQDRTFLSSDLQEDSTVTRNRLAVPVYHQARFSSDSGYTEGFEAGSEENEDLVDERYPHYHQLNELGSGNLTFSEDPHDTYANTSSMADAVLRSLESLGYPSRGTGDTISVGKANDSGQTRFSSKRTPKTQRNSKEEKSETKDFSIQLSNGTRGEDSEAHAQFNEHHYCNYNYRAKLEGDEKEINELRSQLTSMQLSSTENEKSKDNEFLDSAYEIPSDIIQSRLAPQADKKDTNKEQHRQLEETDLKIRSKSAGSHYICPTDFKHYDRLVLDGIKAEEVDYQVLDIGEV